MELRPHQRQAVDFLSERRRAIYADEAGSGKTAASLEWVGNDGRPLLVLAPSDVVGQWPAAGDTWGYRFLTDGRGNPRQRSESRYACRALALNYESARVDAKALAGWVDGGTLICDEAHYLKNHSSLAFKKVAQIARRADRVALLTGTPVLNHPEEVWTLLHLVAPKAYPSYWRWVQQHFYVEVTDFGGRLDRPAKIIGDVRTDWAALENLRSDLHVRMLYRTRLVGGDLPDPAVVRHEVPLNPEERAAYEDLAKKDWTVLDGEFIQTVNTIGRMVRHRQLASEWSALNENLGAGSKVGATADLISEVGEQAVVFTAFKSTARRLVEVLDRMGVTAVCFTGDQTPAQREKAKADFAAGRADVIVGTFGTMCEGVDGLQVARHIVLLDRDWTPARNQQAIARVHRTGQTRPVVVHEVIAADTVDDDISEMLTSKSTLIDSIMESPSAVHQ